jgi:3-deoxy-D-manno-octulosonate 8-phosphate phosphatase (KDO 8-P phosphatase)
MRTTGRIAAARACLRARKREGNRLSAGQPLPDLHARARRVRLLTCDVDGVLTDGRILYCDDGSEIKAFSSLDGIGIKLLQDAGGIVAWITGSNAPAVTNRARVLGVTRVVLGAANKLAPWEALRRELGLAPEQCAHIGDDLPDLPILVRCGLAVTVPNAPAPMQQHAHYMTRARGGGGAVRELCELILSAQGELEPRQKAFTL